MNSFTSSNNTLLPSFERSIAISPTGFVGALLVAAITFKYLLWIGTYAVDMPRADDFDMLIQSLFAFIDSATFSETIRSLFNRHGEHFVVIPKLFFIAEYYLLSKVSFWGTIMIGAIAPIIVALFLCLPLIALQQFRIWYWIPVCIVLCSPLYYQASLWACAALEHLWVMVFVVGAIISAPIKGFKSKFAQVLFALLATLTQGNGFFVLWSLATFYFWTKSYRWALAFFLSGALLALYFSKSVPTIITSEFSISRILDLLHYAIVFLGSGGSLGNSEIAISLGVFFLLIWLIAIVKATSNETRVFVCICLFVVLTSLANALGRSKFGITYTLSQSRYAYPSLIFIASSYLSFLTVVIQRRNKAVVTTAATVASLFLITAGYSQLSPMFSHYRNVGENSAARWNLTQGGLIHPSEDGAKNIFLRLISMKAFQSPNFPLRETPSALTLHTPIEEIIESEGRIMLDNSIVGKNYIVISGFITSKEESKGDITGIKLVLTPINEGVSYDISPLVEDRPDVTFRYRRSDLLKSGFHGVIEKKSLKAETYLISAIVYREQGAQKINSNRKIVIQN